MLRNGMNYNLYNDNTLIENHIQNARLLIGWKEKVLHTYSANQILTNCSMYTVQRVFVTRTLMSCLTVSTTLKSVTFFISCLYHVRFCNCLTLCLYFSISLRSKWGLFQTLKEHYLMHSPYEISLFRQLAFNKSNYTRGLNYRERYHT